MIFEQNLHLKGGNKRYLKAVVFQISQVFLKHSTEVFTILFAYKLRLNNKAINNSY